MKIGTRIRAYVEIEQDPSKWIVSSIYQPAGCIARAVQSFLYQRDAETIGGAFFRGGRDFNPAPVNPIDFIGNVKTDSRGLDSLGIEEKAESLVQALLFHPDAVVCHLEADEAVLLCEGNQNFMIALALVGVAVVLCCLCEKSDPIQ
ncbi:MAG: hypothetical protein ACYTG7_05385 [Planctomycetota bacterium]